jgi:hypothetical protein
MITIKKLKKRFPAGEGYVDIFSGLDFHLAEG